MNKKLIIIICGMLSLTSPSYARLRQDQESGVYYSEGAKRKVNQQEYNDLAEEYLEGCYNIEEILMELNMIGTTSALQLLEDLILTMQEMRQNLQRMYQ